MADAPRKKGLKRRVRKVRRQVNMAKQMAKLAADDPRIVRDLAKGFVASKRPQKSTQTPPASPRPVVTRTPPEALARFDRSATADFETTAAPADAMAVAADVAAWPGWFTLHSAWIDQPPAVLEAGATFGQQIKIMGIPVEVHWTVAEVSDTAARLDAAGRMGIAMSLFVEAHPVGSGSHVYVDIGMSGDPLRGPMGASAVRAVQEALESSAAKLADRVGGSATSRPARKPVLHERTGRTLDPSWPVIVGVGQFVQRQLDADAPLLDPVAMSTRALRAAEEDASSASLLARADAVYAVASASWSYRDQAALVADAVGASPRETVVSARFGGDGGQLMINAACQSIADGEVDIVLVTGAESGATLAAAQKQGRTPDWPTQPAGVAPTRVLGSDREANNAAEAAVSLGAPVFMYGLIESAVRAKAGTTPTQHRQTITELWSRFSDVAAKNPYAWQPESFTADELATVSDDNRMITTPYSKLLCANLQVDMASALIICSVAAASAAGIPQDKWVFVHAGASAHDEWFVSERADFASSPAIRTIGAAALAHSNVGIEDVTHVDLYACFPSAVQIAARELGLPLDDAARPLTTTGGLTFGGGPGNNYGGHGVATLVGALREDADAYGLATSLGWYVTKHAIGIFSARPPEQAFANLHPSVDYPPARPALTGYTGEAVLEAYTLPYGRDGQPESAILAAVTPAGARVLVRTEQPDVIATLRDEDALHRALTITAPNSVTLSGTDRVAVPEPPPSPVLVERRGPVTVITLNRPHVRNAIDRATALLLERAFDAFEADPDARVAVLTGAGGAFSSGMDLKAAARGEFPLSERRGPLGVAGKPPTKPFIAAVEGPALAGGCELALSADLIVASRESQFGIPEPKRGLVAAAGGVLRLAQRLPRAIALELALTGDPMPAARMAELGLINTVVEPGTAVEAAIELAHRIAVNAPMSVAISKRIVDESPDWSTEDAFDKQSELATPAITSDDAREGVLAFAEHREPRWTGH